MIYLTILLQNYIVDYWILLLSIKSWKKTKIVLPTIIAIVNLIILIIILM